MKIEWNQGGLDTVVNSIQQQFDAVAKNHAIPAGSSVDEIETILTEQIRESGATPNPSAVRTKAEEIHSKMSGEQ